LDVTCFAWITGFNLLRTWYYVISLRYILLDPSPQQNAYLHTKRLISKSLLTVSQIDL